MISRSTSESGRAVPLARDPNRRTWASGIAAAIPDAMALMRGSTVIAEALEGAAVMRVFWPGSLGGVRQLYRSIQSTGLSCLSRDNPLEGPLICLTLVITWLQRT